MADSRACTGVGTHSIHAIEWGTRLIDMTDMPGASGQESSSDCARCITDAGICPGPGLKLCTRGVSTGECSKVGIWCEITSSCPEATGGRANDGAGGNMGAGRGRERRET
jgi:hypothetical protein